MRVSEAMRLGAMLDGQAFNTLQDEGGRTCAIGAALKALTGAATWTPAGEEAMHWMTFTGRMTCPACDLIEWHVHNLVVHLNNHHRWPRHQIADWLQTVEEVREVDEVRETAAMPVEKKESVCLV